MLVDGATLREAASLIKTLRDERDEWKAHFLQAGDDYKYMKERAEAALTQAVETKREECAQVAEVISGGELATKIASEREECAALAEAWVLASSEASEQHVKKRDRTRAIAADSMSMVAADIAKRIRARSTQDET